MADTYKNHTQFKLAKARQNELRRAERVLETNPGVPLAALAKLNELDIELLEQAHDGQSSAQAKLNNLDIFDRINGN